MISANSFVGPCMTSGSAEQRDGNNGAHPSPTRKMYGSDANFEVCNDHVALRHAYDDLIAALEKAGYSKAACFAVRVAFEEAVVNGLLHGNAGCPEEPVHVEWSVTPERTRIVVEDRGKGFDPGAVPDPTSPERLELPTGRGIMLMRAYMTSVEYNASGSRVTLVYEHPRR